MQPYFGHITLQVGIELVASLTELVLIALSRRANQHLKKASTVRVIGIHARVKLPYLVFLHEGWKLGHPIKGFGVEGKISAADTL
jgi:hypothetical protein